MRLQPLNGSVLRAAQNFAAAHADLILDVIRDIVMSLRIATDQSPFDFITLIVIVGYRFRLGMGALRLFISAPVTYAIFKPVRLQPALRRPLAGGNQRITVITPYIQYGRAGQHVVPLVDRLVVAPILPMIDVIHGVPVLVRACVQPIVAAFADAPVEAVRFPDLFTAVFAILPVPLVIHIGGPVNIVVYVALPIAGNVIAFEAAPVHEYVGRKPVYAACAHEAVALVVDVRDLIAHPVVRIAVAVNIIQDSAVPALLRMPLVIQDNAVALVPDADSIIERHRLATIPAYIFAAPHFMVALLRHKFLAAHIAHAVRAAVRKTLRRFAAQRTDLPVQRRIRLIICIFMLNGALQLRSDVAAGDAGPVGASEGMAAEIPEPFPTTSGAGFDPIVALGRNPIAARPVIVAVRRGPMMHIHNLARLNGLAGAQAYVGRGAADDMHAMASVRINLQAATRTASVLIKTVRIDLNFLRASLAYAPVHVAVVAMGLFETVLCIRAVMHGHQFVFNHASAAQANGIVPAGNEVGIQAAV